MSSRYIERKVRDVFAFANDSIKETTQIELEEGFPTEEVTTNSYNFSTIAKDIVKEAIVKNVSELIQFLSEGDNSTVSSYESTYDDNITTIRNVTGMINDTMIGNLTTNSTSTGYAHRDTTSLRDAIMITGVVFICAMMYLAHFIHGCKERHNMKEYTESQLIAQYQAKHPTKEEKEGTEMVEFKLHVTSDDESETCGEIRKDGPLVQSPVPKPKRKNDYTAIPLVWDMDGQIVSKAGIDRKEMKVTKKEIATQTERAEASAVPDEFDGILTCEEFEKLKEECKNFKFMDD